MVMGAREAADDCQRILLIAGCTVVLTQFEFAHEVVLHTCHLLCRGSGSAYIHPAIYLTTVTIEHWTRQGSGQM